MNSNLKLSIQYNYYSYKIRIKMIMIMFRVFKIIAVQMFVEFEINYNFKKTY